MFRVFIISSHLMFSRGLENLLRQDADLIILGQETQIEQAMQQIKDLQPEVVILYSDDSRSSSRAIIIEILKISPATRVIGLSLQNNTFFVYQAMQGETTSLEDLFKAIKDRSYPARSYPIVNSQINNEWSNENRPQ